MLMLKRKEKYYIRGLMYVLKLTSESKLTILYTQEVQYLFKELKYALLKDLGINTSNILFLCKSQSTAFKSNMLNSFTSLKKYKTKNISKFSPYLELCECPLSHIIL